MSSSVRLCGTHCMQIFLFPKSSSRFWQIPCSLISTWSSINLRVMYQSPAMDFSNCFHILCSWWPPTPGIIFKVSTLRYESSQSLRDIGALCPTKIKQPEISYIPLQKSRDAKLPPQFESLYFPHICAFMAFLHLPFITINHAIYILTKDTK